jgi:aspartyl-tRNA(Asn)/glutamyl-tRNA(Gln) amidotransferase subunit B
MSLPYETIIGLEVHVQLRTQSKLFCRCSTQFGRPPNTQTCPVCLGLPGALPVLNEQAIHLATKAGLGLNSKIAEFTKWDRKNYFYPDLPKGYQVSQFDLPICIGGHIDLEMGDETLGSTPQRIRLVRAHLEEDAGKSMHAEGPSHPQSPGQSRADTRIDLNRTGTPLLEIVSEPDMRSAESAKQFLTQLRLLLLYLDVSDCNMQEGSLRVDANVNLHLVVDGESIATPIAEIKNLNSFRSVERAIDFESDRQYHQFLRDGKKIGQAPKQTRGWDDAQGVTILQRQKEESDEYRYFPDPDLAPVVLTVDDIDVVREAMPELPTAKKLRYQSELGLSEYDADVLVSQGPGVATYFESTVASGATAKRASSWMQQDVLRTLNETETTIDEFPISPATLGDLLHEIDLGTFNTSRGREVFQLMLTRPELTVDAATVELGIESVDSSAVEALCRELLAANENIVAKVKEGNVKALGALVGQAKKRDRNMDPKTIQDTCLRIINSQES